ncbi:MAG TPA: hypothetical protein VFQ61_17525 [Polyangiaceae bacterium]|nr:hypothetical protein [Polyangiaceae bacterium]
MSSSLGLCAVPQVAHAAHEPAPAQIREAANAFDQGRAAYKKENWVEAAEYFEHAYDSVPSARALEYAIRARDKAGQLDRAATLAALAERRYSDEASLQKLVPGILARARESLYELFVTCPEPCDLAVAGKIVPGEPELQRRIYVYEGRQSVRAAYGGDRNESREVTARSGGKGDLSFDSQVREDTNEGSLETTDPSADDQPAKTPTPKPAQDAARSASGLPQGVFFTGVALSSVGVLVTTLSGIDTLKNPGKDRIRNECEQGDTSCPVYQDGLDRQRRTNVLLGVTAGLSIATTLVGVFWTDWSSRPDSEPSEEYVSGRRVRRSASAARPRSGARVTPVLSLGQGAFVGAQGSF